MKPKSPPVTQEQLLKEIRKNRKEILSLQERLRALIKESR